MTASVSPYPIELDKFVKKRQWEEAVRLCRFVKSDPLWAALAGGAIGSLHLDTAEIALAAMKEVDKLHYILYIKDIPLEEGQNAEIALYQRRPDEAERILLQAESSACLSCDQDEHTIISMEAGPTNSGATQETHRYCIILSSKVLNKPQP